PMPRYAMMFLLVTLSSIGLPLMNGFIGEFLILSGTAQMQAPYAFLVTILATSGVIWSAAYMLWMYQRAFYGEITVPANRDLPDIDLRERLALVPLVVMALIMGLYSPYWMNAISPASRQINDARTIQRQAPLAAAAQR